MINPAYVAMLEESVRQGMPSHYKDDLLKIDKDELEKHNPDQFGWILRECGTELLLPAYGVEHNRAVARYWTKGEPHYDKNKCYWWDGECLSSVTRQTLLERLSHVQG